MMRFRKRGRFAFASIVMLLALAGCLRAPERQSVPTSTVASPPGLPGRFLQGNGFSGAERGFGASIEENWGPAIPGVEGSTYWWPFPTDNELPSGMNTVRLPFQWERLQPALNGDFDASYLARLHETANAWRQLGLNVLLDVHNYAHYKVNGRGTTQPGQRIGSPEVPVAAFGDFWTRMALEFGEESTASPFIFGLMNEPHDVPVAVWVDAAQQAVDAIRGAGANNPVFVPGADWSTAKDFAWSENRNLLQTVSDPIQNMAIEVHQYFDGSCKPSSLVDLLGPFERWAVANGRVGFLGETDLTDKTDVCREAFGNLIEHLHGNAAGRGAGVWIGYTYWEGAGVRDVLPLIQPHLPSTCTNDVRNAPEPDVNCGTMCPRCADGMGCAHGSDCQSGVCSTGRCTKAVRQPTRRP